MVENQAFQEFERAGWEEVAGQYAEISDGVTIGVAPVLCDSAGVSGSSAVLDVASGPGWTAAVAAERARQVVGLDIAQAMVELASARHPGIGFRQGTAEDLPFDDGVFDAALSAFGMPHFADHAAFAAAKDEPISGAHGEPPGIREDQSPGFWLDELARWVEAGELESVVNRSYCPEQIGDAHVEVEQYEWIGTYEPEQLDEALAELERQHSAIIDDDQDRA